MFDVVNVKERALSRHDATVWRHTRDTRLVLVTFPPSSHRRYAVTVFHYIKALLERVSETALPSFSAPWFQTIASTAHAQLKSVDALYPYARYSINRMDRTF